jgi:glycine/D-amino acid oxidase-like deaminating enzyme
MTTGMKLPAQMLRESSGVGGVSGRWREDAPPASEHTQLSTEHETDVAIVGGGIAGLSVAYHLAEMGIQCAVLEAEEIGEGATGRSGGIIASLPVRHSPGELIEKYGEQRGRKLITLFGDSGKYTFSLISRHQLQCYANSSGFLAPGKAGKNLLRLQNLSAQWQSFGYDIQYLNEPTTSSLSGLGFYGGALLDVNGGSLNPLAYAEELARVSVQYGAQIFRKSPVTGVSRNSDRWHLTTAKGSVTARHVLFCAGEGNGSLHPGLKRSTIPLNVFEFATAPLGSDARKTLLPRGHALTDTHANILTLRYDQDGRIITAFPSNMAANQSSRVVAAMRQRLEKVSSVFQGVEIEDVWRGTASICASFLPEVYKTPEGAYVVQACNGRGLALNTILGRDLARCVVEGDDGSAVVSQEKPRSFRPHVIASRVPNFVANLARYRSALGEKVASFIRRTPD